MGPFRKLVLLVEDDADLGAVLSETIAGEGYRVRLAVDGRSARAALAEERPALVLLDWTLPDTDAAMLAGEFTGLKVPVVLASGMDEARDCAERIGAVGFLRKPYDAESLLGVLERFAGTTPAADARP